MPCPLQPLSVAQVNPEQSAPLYPALHVHVLGPVHAPLPLQLLTAVHANALQSAPV